MLCPTRAGRKTVDHGKSRLRRRTLRPPFVIVPFLQFPVDEVSARTGEHDEPLTDEPLPVGLADVEHRPAARPLGRALTRRDCCINGDSALKGAK
jgi:hypothetical protein